MTAMSMGGEGSGRKGNERDRQTLNDLKKAVENQPPKKVVTSWKKTVRRAVRGKKK